MSFLRHCGMYLVAALSPITQMPPHLDCCLLSSHTSESLSATQNPQPHVYVLSFVQGLEFWEMFPRLPDGSPHSVLPIRRLSRITRRREEVSVPTMSPGGRYQQALLPVAVFLDSPILGVLKQAKLRLTFVSPRCCKHFVTL